MDLLSSLQSSTSSSSSSNSSSSNSDDDDDDEETKIKSSQLASKRGRGRQQQQQQVVRNDKIIRYKMNNNNNKRMRTETEKEKEGGDHHKKEKKKQKIQKSTTKIIDHDNYNNNNDNERISIIHAKQASTTHFIRSIPHRQGHWSGHIYIPIPSWKNNNTTSVYKSINKFRKKLLSLKKKIDDNTSNNNIVTIVRHDTFHLSLSKPFSLHLGQIDSFVNQLTTRLVQLEKTILFVDNRKGNILINDDKTRSFWGWIVQPNNVLRQIVKSIDTVLTNYNQATYYDPPIFHISLASIAGNIIMSDNENDSGSCSSDDTSSSSSSDNDDDDTNTSSDGEEEEDTETISVSEIHCTFGTTKKYVIKLKSG